MKVNETVRLDSENFELCPPGKREQLLSLHRRLLPVSLLICDQEGRLVFGHEWLRELHRSGSSLDSVPVQCLSLTEVEGWLTAYRLLDSFQLAGLYEQLNLWRNVGRLLSAAELRKQLSLPFPLHESVREGLSDLFAGPLRENLERDELVWQALFRIMGRDRSEWPAWSLLYSLSRFSRSRQIAMLDILEEIQFRDKRPLGEIVDELSRDLDDRDVPGDILWNRAYAMRYPRCDEMEALWHRQVKALGLPPGVSLRHVPFFESRHVDLNARFPDFEQFLSFWNRKG